MYTTPDSPTPSSSAMLLGERQSMRVEKELKPRAAVCAETLPVEILCFIFEILAVGKGTVELKNCASTCRRWAIISLPLLYRYYGFGVYEYLPSQLGWKRNPLSEIPYSDSPFLKQRSPAVNLKVAVREACYWRTLLLSCFWEEEQCDQNFTLYPYICYVENLDFLGFALVVVAYPLRSYQVRASLFGVGTKMEEFMNRKFGNTQDTGLILLPRMLNVVLPKAAHLKSANIFIGNGLPGFPLVRIPRTITQPVLELVGQLSRLSNLEIYGQENLTPAFGAVLKALRPSLINAGNETINKNHTFTLRITGSSRVSLDPLAIFRRDKGFLDALNSHSVSSLDFDISDRWGWTLEVISGFMLHQARALKSIRLRGVGDTIGVWQLLDKMGQRGCRLRGLDIENRHVHHPPVILESTVWAFKSTLLRKLKYLTVEGFQGITNSETNYHMIDPTSFSILLKHSLFGGRSTGNRLTPPIKTLILTRAMCKSKVPEQIGAFIMHLAPTLTTLELEYYDCNVFDDIARGAQFRQQGRYKLIEVLLKLSQLERLKVVGYSASTFLSSCIPEEVDDEVGTLSRPRSPVRPSTPVGYTLSDGVPLIGSSSYRYPHHPHPPSSLYQRTVASGFRPGWRSPAFRLFTTTWKSNLEELEIVLWKLQTPALQVCLVDDTLLLFTLLEKLRTLKILFSEDGCTDVASMSIDGAGTGAGANYDPSSEPSAAFGKLTSRGILRFVNALPNKALLQDKMVMQNFSLSRNYVDDIRYPREAWPHWVAEVTESMKSRGGKFVLM